MSAAVLSASWPLVVVVLSNILYNLTTKSIPKNCSPWLVLVVTYLTASFLSFISYFIFENHKNFMESVGQTSWLGFVLGASMVGLEIGYIFIYRTGWKISVASLLVNVLLAVALLFIGLLWYKENLSTRQIFGIVLCLLGCWLIVKD